MYTAGSPPASPLAMADAIATLAGLRKTEEYEKLARQGQMVGDGVMRVIHETGGALRYAHIGSMFGLFFTAQPVVDYASARTSDTARYARFFWHMLAHGIYLPPSQFETCFISLALDDEMIEETVKHVEL